MLKKIIFPLLVLCAAPLYAQHMYNYPVPVAGLTDGQTEQGGQAQQQQTGGNFNTGQENTGAGVSYDRNLGITESNTRQNRKIKDSLDIKKEQDDIYYAWLKLAILGKDQYEIENYYREISPEVMALVKQRLRNKVMYNLERRSLAYYAKNASEVSEIRIAVNIVNEEMRSVSLEHDAELKYLIKEQYRLNPFSLDEITNTVRAY